MNGEPLTDVEPYPVLVAPGVFESLVDRVEWGEPDAEGFYTPTLYRATPATGTKGLRGAVLDLCNFTARYLAGDSDVLPEDVYAAITEARAALGTTR